MTSDHVLSDRVQEFVNRVERLQTPTAVLDALYDISHRHCGLTPLGAWYLPREFKGQELTWHLGKTVFVHRSTPKDFVERYIALNRQNGFSFMSAKARRSSVPFTFAQAEKEAKSQRSPSQWVFAFMRGQGFNDGLCCAFRRWVCLFVSRQLLALSPGDRACLSVAGQFAVGRIEDIIMKPRKGGRKKPNGILTPRECEVLQQIAIIGDHTSVAKALNISIDSVDVHLRNARRKLKVKSTGQALLTAFKNRWIEY